MVLPSEDSIKEYLTLKEVGDLHNLYDSGTLSKKLQNTLFYFLIACYTGLRFSDVGRLNALYLKQSGKQFFISMLMKKTRKPVEIPLSNRVVKLFMKRVGFDYMPSSSHEIDLLSNEGLFSKKLKQSNSRVNNDIREIIALQKINKYISFHCSRHSFAINSLVLGIILEVISNILGQTQLKTTQIYAKIVNKLKVKRDCKLDCVRKKKNEYHFYLTQSSLQSHISNKFYPVNFSTATLLLRMTT